MSQTPEEQYLLRKLLDPVSFLQHFVSIETPEGYVPWMMDGYQKGVARDQSRNIAINKSKKIGLSTTITGKELHKVMLFPGKQVVFISTGQRIAGELLGKFYDHYDSMPESLKPEIKPRSIQEAGFPNKSRVYSLPSHNPENIRGLGLRGTSTDVIADEFASAPKDNELWVVIRDFQRIGGSVTIISTPRGKRGMFYKICDSLQTIFRGLSKLIATDWSYHEIPYTECPRLVNQEAELKKDISDIDFKQEYTCEFIDESVSYFPYEIIWDCQTVREYAENGINSKNPIYFGIDFGKTTSETIIYIVEEYETEKFRTIWIEVLPGVNYHDQLEVIKQLNISFNPTEIRIDASGPGGQTMEDFMGNEETLKYKMKGYDLTSPFKGMIITRTRILMERKRFQLPIKELPYGEKVETQFHGIQRTVTSSGEHTRFSGKETVGYDDIVWAACLAVYKEFTVDYEPFFGEIKDPFLDKMMPKEEELWIAVKSWEI